jgi:MFS family permease
VVFLVLIVLGGGASTSIMGFIPLYVVAQFHVTKQTAASLLSIVYGAGLVASPLGGYLSDRIGRIRIILVACLVAGIFIYIMEMVPYGLGLGNLFFIDGLGTGAVMLFIGMSNSVRMPVSESYIGRQTTSRNRSTVYGIYYFAMTEAGAVFAPLYGYLIDNYGFHYCFTIASIIVVAVTLVCSVFLWSSQD